MRVETEVARLILLESIFLLKEFEGDLPVASDEALSDLSYGEQETVDLLVAVAEPEDDLGEGVELGMILQELTKHGCRVTTKRFPSVVLAFLFSTSTRFAPKGTLLVGDAEMELLWPNIFGGLRGKGIDSLLPVACTRV